MDESVDVAGGDVQSDVCGSSWVWVWWESSSQSLSEPSISQYLLLRAADAMNKSQTNRTRTWPWHRSWSRQLQTSFMLLSGAGSSRRSALLYSHCVYCFSDSEAFSGETEADCEAYSGETAAVGWSTEGTDTAPSGEARLATRGSAGS